MIKDIKELNFPAYATLETATATISDMGDRTITSQVKIDGDVVPDFSYDWEVEFKGERYIHPVKTPQGTKDNTSRKSKIDLVFQHWAIYEMKRQYFVEMASTSAGTAIADKYIASLGLNLGDFVTAFNLVLNHYFGGRIIIKLNPEWQYDTETKFVSISYSYIWDVLQQMHEIYGVRWTLKTNADGVCEILMGYPAQEVSHIFEYGFEGGLLSVQRQVQSAEIRNRLLGRGGSKNLPARYFKDKDPNNPLFEADPDWIPELANIAFTELRGKTFRDYVKGWKAKRYNGSAMAQPTEAYLAGYNASKFDPIEYVEDKDSIGKYGVLVGALENNEEIYPSIQGAPGNVDAIVDAEQVTDDDVDSAVENDSVTTNLESGHQTYRNAPANSVVTIETLTKRYFSVPEGKVGNLSMSLTATGKYSNFGDYEETYPVLKADTAKVTIYDKITGVEVKSSSVPVVDIPAGDYYYMVSADVETNYDDITMVTLNIESVYLYTSTPNKSKGWKQTFDIWIRNIWGSTRKAGETDQQYADRVWAPILGDRMGGEARVVFATGWLSFSSDWEFPIVGYAFDSSKSGSEWRLTLAKSEAELEASGKYIPYEGYNASTGDKFFFIGVDMPYEYVTWAEERLDDYKRDALLQTANINPTWVIKTDKVRLNQERVNEKDEKIKLIDSLNIGSQIRLASKQFIADAYETLYVQSMTYSWQADTLLHPDIEIVVSDKVVSVKNPVAQIQSNIESIQRQVGSLSNIQQIIRQVCDKLYLRKDGFSDISKSPTRFLGKISGENFRPGQIGGRDWGIYRDENGNAILEADKLVARQGILVNELIVSEATYVGGLQINSAASMNITVVEETENGYVCFFDQKQGTVTNKFVVDDVVLCQRFDADQTVVKFYKARVTAVSEDSVTLSKIEVNGTGIPAVDDAIIQYGNYSDKTRQYVIVRDVIGGGYERMLMHLDSVESDGVEYYFAGKSADSTARWFVGGTEQFAEYRDGQLTIKGNVFVTGSDKNISEQLAQIDFIREAFGENAQGLVLGTAIIVGYTDENENFVPMAGLSGVYDKDAENGGPAAWYGGTPDDAKSVIFMDGTGYFADGLFRWDKDKGIDLGNGQLKINYDGSVDFGENIKIGTSEETLGTILTFMANFKDWFYLTEDGQIGTKYDFFSEGEISANGMNAGLGGGGSTGGGLITSVLGKSAFGSVASEDNSTTFNAFAIDSLYKRLMALEGKNVDLSGYYTSAQTDSAIAAALVPYVKTSDADAKYASLSSFNALKGSFDALNSALNDDVSGKINTWNEIVDFLNEYSGSQDLATILSGMNSDIASRLKTSDFETWKAHSFNPLVDRVTTAERNITKNTNAINSINSHMQGVDDTITAIQKQTDGINQRVKTLETWRTATDKTITSLSSQVSTNTTNIDTNRRNIERIFSWFSEDADGNVFTTRNFYSTLEVSGNGLTNGTGGGGGSYPRLDSWANYDPAAGAVLSAILGNDLRMRIESQGSRISALEGASTSVSVSNLSSVGTRIATITIDGVAHEVKGDFLSTRGGTIIGNSGALDIKRNGPYLSCIKFSNTDGALGNLGFVWANNPAFFHTDGNYYPLYHTGNFNPANYLPLSGGTVKSADTAPLTIDTSDATMNSLLVKLGGTLKAQLVYHTTYGAYIANDTVGYRLGIDNSGVPFYFDGSNKTLIHSGNIGSQTVNAAFELKNYGGRVANANVGTFGDGALRIYLSSTSMTSNKPPFDGTIMHFAWDNTGGYEHQLFVANNGVFASANERMAWRGQNGGTWSEWKSVAFTDSNVASATKLATARTIWGRPFDGTDNVSGNLNLNRAKLIWHGEESYSISCPTTATAAKLLYKAFDGHQFEYSGGIAMLINPSGNVTIGGSDLAGTGTKLRVDGTICGGSLGTSAIYFNNGSKGLCITGTGIAGWMAEFGNGQNGVLIGCRGESQDVAAIGTIGAKSLLLNPDGGNVGIGTSTDSGYKLNVAGDIASSGALRVGPNSAYGAYLQTNDEGGWTGIHSANKGNWQATNMYFMPNGDVRFAHAARVIGKNTNGDTGLFVEGAQYSIWFGIGSGNVNRGIYDINNNGWWIYRDASTLTRISGGISTSTGAFSGAVTISNTLDISSSVGQKQVVTITDSSALSSYGRPLTALYPNAVKGAHIDLYVGVANSTKNGGYVGFYYDAAASDNNRISLGLYGVDNVLNINGKRHVLINTTVDSGYELDMNGTARVNGAVTMSSALSVGGESTFADHVTITSGKRLKLAASNGIFLNNYGIHYQGASANAVNSIFSFSDSGYTTTIHSFFVNPASGVDVQLGNSEYPFYSLATKQIKAHTFYKVSEATNASGQTHQSKAGWYRIFTSRPTNAGSTPIRLFIARNYTSTHNESYVFDITVSYNGKINITQVSGINNSDAESLIDQIRVDWTNSNIFYIDFHKKVENNYSNQYMVWGIGDGEFQTPTRVSDTPVGTAYKFNTRRGFKQQGEAFFTTANPYSGNISAPTVVTIDAVDEYATALNVFGKIKLKNLVEFYYHSSNKAVRLSHSFYSDGEISANGLSSSSDIRYKNRMNDVSLSLDTIANAPIFRYTWKHIEDGKVHLGTSAQYWLDTEAKELVSINNEDFHRLDYATLGVMMGVTLAKKAKSHEERIKELEMKVESLEAENRRLRYGN